MVKKYFLILLASLAMLAMAGRSMAEDVYFNIPIQQLKITEGKLPPDQEIMYGSFGNFELRELMQPRAVLDKGGEIYVSQYQPFMDRESVRQPQGRTEPYYFAIIRVPKGQPVSGRLFIPKHGGKGMDILKFTAAQKGSASDEARKSYFKAKADYFKKLSGSGIPGTAWFRHQTASALKESGETTSDTQARADRLGRNRAMNRPSRMEDNYALFTGDQAISENLQLDRPLILTESEKSTVDIKTIEGISIKAVDWKALTKGEKPAADPLARNIPADQHVIFFPSFTAMVELLDEARLNGTPILRMLNPRSEDNKARERYERQLCLASDGLSRLLGPQMVASVAFTGSDPDLRSGSDVAVLFEAKDPALLKGTIMARQAAAQKADPAIKAVSGKIQDVAYQGILSPDRAVSSYVAVLGKAVVVTNSLYQLGQIARASQGKMENIGQLGEYDYFRTRYKRNDSGETALVILSDGTIRRWCSPRWRITQSRRIKAAMVLAELQTRHMDELMQGKLPKKEKIAGGGEITWSANGPASSIYGSIAFLTPIAEIPLEKVSQPEAQAYEQFRAAYQERWARFFDPIAIRFGVKPERLSMDLTVLPLILGSEYRQVIDVVQKARIKPNAGDRHEEALWHLAMSINRDAESIRQLGSVVTSARQQPLAVTNPLGWLGQSLAVYADADPFWKELGEAKNKDEFLSKNVSRFPLALNIEVADPLRLAAFMTMLHAFAEQSAPGLTRWNNQTYKEQPYVKVSSYRDTPSSGSQESFAICYAATPSALIVSPSETMLKRALDRMAARKAAKGAGLKTDAPAWLGANLCLVAKRGALDIIQTLVSEEYQNTMKARSWSNLPILNEWHRLYPKQSPVELHERFWHRRLVCPGGGEYVWNDQWQTMESTVYGHPGAPKAGPAAPAPLERIATFNTGLTFENDGLRVLAVAERNTPGAKK